MEARNASPGVGHSRKIIASGLFHPSLLNALNASQAVMLLDTPEYRQRVGLATI